MSRSRPIGLGPWNFRNSTPAVGVFYT
jgi:hypothetical protein